MSLVVAAGSMVEVLRRHGVAACLVGGLAVSTRCDPRFTLDADLAVAVGSDEHAEAVVRALFGAGYRAGLNVEQEVTGRLAMVRFTDQDDTSLDLLFASSGIEVEVVAEAESMEVVRGQRLPVARVGHLIALKLLSAAPGRETDYADLRGLAGVADEQEWDRATAAVTLITERGFARGRNLIDDLSRLRHG
ncbi:MAG: hypothetical protein RI900_489 [Actinomycetota bacterium]|jgi:hypothetical protein